MTPEKRLNQIVLQKVDRLIESNGKIIEVVVDAKVTVNEVQQTANRLGGEVGSIKQTVTRLDEKVESIKVSGESNACAVANLTVTTQHQFDELRIKFDELKSGQDLILQILHEKLL